jgi:pimeloyl-ACP methyl ester carboxylesterase
MDGRKEIIATRRYVRQEASVKLASLRFVAGVGAAGVVFGVAMDAKTFKNVRQGVVILAVVVFGASRMWHRMHAHKSGNTVTGQYDPRTDELVLGSLRLKNCTPGGHAAVHKMAKRDQDESTAYCGKLTVPERRDAPSARNIDLKLAVVRSRADAAERDILVFIAGGPGQSAIDTFDSIAPAFAPLLEHHHVLLLDQRGTGAAHALRCDHGDEEEEGSLDLERVRRHSKACREKLSKDADLRGYTTTEAVEDLEAVRQALGAPTFDLVGGSYGTRVAQQYVMRHPDGVRSVVLDGVVPNEEILGQHMARDLESALRLGYDACTAAPECKKRYGDAYATLKRVHEHMTGKPVPVAYRDANNFDEHTRKLGGFGVASMVRLFAYTSETAALLPLLIDEADHERYGPITALLAMVDDDLKKGINDGMATSVMCSEDVDLLEPDPADADRLLGVAFAQAQLATCEGWPRGTRPADFHTPLHSDKPILLLSGERDPVTPPIYGEAVLKGLSNARHLVARGQGHNVMPRGCLPRLVRRFVETLDARGLDASCMDLITPTPAFLDYNGAAP